MYIVTDKFTSRQGYQKCYLYHVSSHISIFNFNVNYVLNMLVFPILVDVSCLISAILPPYMCFSFA